MVDLIAIGYPDETTAIAAADTARARADWAVAAQLLHREAVAQTDKEPGPGWTVVLRRQPVRIVEGRPEGGYTDAYEIVCCDCGDDPSLDYRDVSPELQMVRGPHAFTAGIAAYLAHVGLQHGQQPAPEANQLRRRTGSVHGKTG